MIQKQITYFGAPVVLACDGKCGKAWGINNRPRLYYMADGEPPRQLGEDEEARDPDDYVFLGDDALLDAPADPGTYEGGHGKPCSGVLTDPERMNKWCARECERSNMTDAGKPPTIPDMRSPRPNMPHRRAPIGTPPAAQEPPTPPA